MGNIVITRCVFFLLIFCVAVVHVSAYGAENDADEKLRLAKEISKLQAADVAWRSNDSDFRKLREEQDQASESEIREFAEFVAVLKRQVIEGCEVVRKLGGDAGRHGVDCVNFEDEPESKKGGALPNIKRETTREEKVALLTNQMKKLESDFDAIILKQQDKLKGQVGISQRNEGWANGADDKSEANKTPDAGVPSCGTVRPKAGPIHWEAEPGAGPGVEKKGKMPDFKTGNVGDVSDDDVVARQLREAAEAETDQLLKEQLWEEYKKYKNSTR